MLTGSGDTVESCTECQQNRATNPAMPLQPHEVSSYPYQVVASDLFQLDGHSYLLEFDCYSKWPSVVKLADTRSSTMIGHLEKMFCDFGIPQMLLSDNGAQYGSSEFCDFAKRRHMQHTTTRLMAERMVQTIKKSLTKMLADRKSLLQTSSSTPIGDGLPSPAVLMQVRNLLTNLHQMEHMLRPQHIDAEVVRRKLEERQSTAAYYHDAATSTFQWELHPGETVRMRQTGNGSRRSSDDMIRCRRTTGSGSVLRRNRNQINTTVRGGATPARDNSNDVSDERVSRYYPIIGQCEPTTKQFAESHSQIGRADTAS